MDVWAIQNPPEWETNSTSRPHGERRTSQGMEMGTFRQIENSTALSHEEHKTANNRDKV